MTISTDELVQRNARFAASGASVGFRTPDMSRKFVQDSSREQWPLPAFGQQGVTGRPDMVITEVSVCCAEDRRVPRGRAR